MMRFSPAETHVLAIMKDWHSDDKRGMMIASLMPELSKAPNINWVDVLTSLELKGLIRGTDRQVLFTESGYKLMYPETLFDQGESKVADSLEHKKATRYNYLKALYEETNGDEAAVVNMFEIGKAAGLDEIATRVVFDYLQNEGLVEAIAFGGVIKVTHAGVKEYEESLEHPNEPTRHFPALNIINNYISVGGNMTGTQIQQGSTASSQTLSQPSLDLEATKKWIGELEAKISSAGLNSEQMNIIVESIETAKAILSTQRPNQEFLRSLLSSIKSVLEGVAGNVIAALILNMPH